MSIEQRGRGNDDMVDDRSLPPSKDGATSRQVSIAYHSSSVSNL